MAPQTPEEQARARLQAQVFAAAAGSAATGTHEGHWSLHHLALASGPGDFTPYQETGRNRGRSGSVAMSGCI